MTVDVAALLDFRRRYPGLSWEQLGALFALSGHQAREIVEACHAHWVRRAA
jgi:hypothetical protein